MNICVPYCLECPRTYNVRVLGRASYVSAALLGSLFVLFHAGCRAFLKALPINILLLIGMWSAVFAAAWIGGLPRLLLLLVAPSLLIVLQGRAMILVVRDHYVEGGWYAFEI